MRIKPIAALAVAVLFTTVLAITACGGGSDIQPTSAPAASTTSLAVSGAGGAARVLNHLADEYAAKYGDLEFKFLDGSGSGGGVKGVVAGTLDLGTMSRLPKDSEVELGIEHIAFAYDPVVVATSGDVELVGLTSQQVRSIFDGTATNWAEFGGPDSLITVLTREEDDSNTKIMRNGIIGDTEFAPGSLLVTSEDELKAAIVKIPSSIGYMAHSGVQLDSLSVNVMALDGYQPSDADPNYPLENRILGVAYLPANTSKVQRFLEFITGKEAASFLSENGIPPLYQGR